MVLVLLVEDDAPFLDLTRRYLERDGTILTEVAQSGEEAIAMIAAREFDAVVTDYEMSGMDGITLLKTIRESGNRVPFIIFTGRGTEDVAVEALNTGADFYLRKAGDPKAQFAQLRNMIVQTVDRRDAKEALAQSIRRLSDIINAIPDATFATDSGGKIIAWNRAIERMTGISPEDMLGLENREYAIPFHHPGRSMLIDLIFASDEEILKHGYSVVRRKGRAVCGEITLPVHGGGERVLWMVATPLYDERGGVAGAIESIRDISDQRRTSAALQEKTIIVQALLRNPVIGIALLDAGLEIKETNGVFSRIFSGVASADFARRLIPERIRQRIERGERVRYTLDTPISPDAGDKPDPAAAAINGAVVWIERVSHLPREVRYLVQVIPEGTGSHEPVDSGRI